MRRRRLPQIGRGQGRVLGDNSTTITILTTCPRCHDSPWDIRNLRPLGEDRNRWEGHEQTSKASISWKEAVDHTFQSLC